MVVLAHVLNKDGSDDTARCHSTRVTELVLVTENPPGSNHVNVFFI